MGLDNPIHIAFLLILMLLVFGAKRLPEMGRSLGEGMRGFKDAIGGEGARPAPELASAERVGAGRSGAERVGAGRVSAERSGAERVGAGRLGAERVAAE